jgi:hypothetical protein
MSGIEDTIITDENERSRSFCRERRKPVFSWSLSPG